MKKFILAILLMFCCSTMFGQTFDIHGIPTNNLNIQVADATVPVAFTGVALSLGYAIGASMAAVISGGNAEIDGFDLVGVTPFVSAGYDYHFPGSRWSVGGELGYWHCGIKTGDDSPVQHMHFGTITAAGKFFYKPNGICKLYGGMNAGLGLVLSSGEVSPIPAIQITPIGMRLGNESVAFTAELGAGYKGFIQAGLNVSL